MTWRWLLVVALFTLTAAPGCCCDQGVNRMTRVVIDDETGGPSIRVSFSGQIHDFPVKSYFTAFRVGTPSGARVRTVPMLELWSSDKLVRLPLDRFLGENQGGCAKAEIYEPPLGFLSIGETYLLVHRAATSPGQLEDTGNNVGDEAANIVSFRGEPSLVGRIRAVPERNWTAGQGGSGAGGMGAGGMGAGGMGAGGLGVGGMAGMGGKAGSGGKGGA